jgi:hypothetical protein
MRLAAAAKSTTTNAAPMAQAVPGPGRAGLAGAGTVVTGWTPLTAVTRQPELDLWSVRVPASNGGARGWEGRTTVKKTDAVLAETVLRPMTMRLNASALVVPRAIKGRASAGRPTFAA